MGLRNRPIMAALCDGQILTANSGVRGGGLAPHLVLHVNGNLLCFCLFQKLSCHR